MSQVFYDHLIIIDEVTTELDSYNLTSAERQTIIDLIDQTLHHRILDIILSSLPADKHEDFLSRLHRAPYDRKLLDYLRAETGIDIETEIKKEAQKVKQEILTEIRRSEKARKKRS